MFLHGPAYWPSHGFSFFSFFKKIFILSIFREREREGESEGEKYRCEKHWLVASHMPLNEDLARNPGTYPDQKLNQQPFGLWFARQHPTHWATPVWDPMGFLNLGQVRDHPKSSSLVAETVRWKYRQGKWSQPAVVGETEATMREKERWEAETKAWHWSPWFSWFPRPSSYPWPLLCLDTQPSLEVDKLIHFFFCLN